MFDENKADIITLTDENNKEKTFEILDTIEDERGKFFALSPIRKNLTDLIGGSADFLVLQEIENGEETDLIEPKDPILLSELTEEFEDRFNALFD